MSYINTQIEKDVRCLYQGRDLPHWREKFKGKICGQLFLHYTSPDAQHLYDTRKHIGLPNSASMKGKKN